ncbi:carbohydrate binding domain-containing protein, partial [Streptacidiphilus griseoplanus]|uniref:carbohydrate binding domain-containing protein n=1 Tax=Peterkaempfera griseoplana TaxID=66896 RepID=UPI000A8B2EAA
MRRPRPHPRPLTAAATALATAAAATLAAAIGFAPAAHAGEFLSNGGFESGLAGWSCSNGSAVTGHAHSGSYALAGAASASDTAQCTQTVPVAPGTTYTLSSYVNGAYVYLGVDGGASTWTPSTGGAYSKLSLSFTTGATQTSATVFLHGWYGQGTYYADDVSLDGPGAPATTP